MPSFELKHFPPAVRKKRSSLKKQQDLKNRKIIHGELKNFFKEKIPIADYYNESDYIEHKLASFSRLTRTYLPVQTPLLKIPPVSETNPSSDIPSLKEFTFCDHDLTNFLTELSQEDNAETQKTK